MPLLVLALLFLLLTPVCAEPLAPLAPHLATFKELSGKDAMLSRLAKNAIREKNITRLVEILRTQSLIRTQEIENRSQMLEALCRGSSCADAAKNLQNLGMLLQTSLTDMRVAIAGRSLTLEESASILHIGTNLQQSYKDALLSLLRYTIATLQKKDEKTPASDIFSLRDLPELADIPMLPPPPGKGDLRLGK